MKKKAMYAILLATLMVFMVPVSGYAAHSGVHGSVGIRSGHPGWGGHYVDWHRHYRPWGPRSYWGGSIVIGPPWYSWYPYPYPYGYYSAPPVVQSPPVYVEPQQPQQNYWYYCQDPQGYYPYVNNCPGGWMKVVPQPAPPKP